MPLWTPANIASGAVAWIDGDSVMSDAAADGAGSPVTTNGAAVARVVSRLPSAVAFRQSTVGLRPLLRTDAGLPGGQRVLQVPTSSTDARLVCDSRTLASDLTMVCVMRVLGTAGGAANGINNFFRLFGRYGSGAAQFATLIGTPAGSFPYRAHINNAGSGGGFSDVFDGGAKDGNNALPWRIMVLSKVGTGSNNGLLQIDGGRLSNTQTVTWSGTTGSLGICGAADDGQTQSQELAAAVVVEGDVNANDPITGQSTLNTIVGCFAHLYGLAGNLPGGHPFKSSAPWVPDSGRSALALSTGIGL